MKTSNLAIVFTDIKGFTARTSQQTYEENQRMLRVHDALLTPVFKAFGGRPIKTIGDSFLVVFDSPTQAVLCGVAIQDRLWDYNRRVAEAEQIHVRVAVNMGEVRVERGDVFGEPVNIAARVEGLADAGEVLFTEAVYLSMNKAEVPSQEHGVHELKGIPEKVRVYRVPPGGYRLASEPQLERPADSPPFGGIALSRLADLPAPEPAQLAATGELIAHLGAAASSLASVAKSQARSLSQRGAGLLADLRRRVAALPKSARLAGLGLIAALALAGAGWWLFGGDPIERTISRGDFNAAKAEIKKLEDGPRKSYLEGRLHEEKREFERAASDYYDSAKAGERKGFRRLIRMTENSACSARTAAALTLGLLGDRSAAGALRDLSKSEFADENKADSNVFGQIFGCKSRQVAVGALEKLEKDSQ